MEGFAPFVVVKRGGILTFTLFSSINFAGFLAVPAGLSEDNADLGKQHFSLCSRLGDGNVPETTNDGIS